jgi:DNA-binding IclR family transcriptional regulator
MAIRALQPVPREAAPTGAPASCSEVAAAMKVSRPAARRILLTLAHLGYVGEESGRFQSTPKVLSLGRGVLGGGGLWSRVAPEVVALADRLNEPCSVSILDGLETCSFAETPPAGSSPPDSASAIACRRIARRAARCCSPRRRNGNSSRG